MSDSEDFVCDECGFVAVNKNGLGSHMGSIHPDTNPWNDPKELERLYWEEGLSLQKIADKMGCGAMTIHNKMEEFGIERRERVNHLHSTPAYYGVNMDGYEEWWSYNGEDKPRKRVSVHQLLACLNTDPHEVFDPSNHVHHGSESHLPECEIPWANWEGNLQVMSSSDHWSHHNSPAEAQSNQQTAMEW